MFELHDAVRHGNVNEIIKILQRDPSKVNDYDFYLRTPIHYLYDKSINKNNDIVIINLLVEHGANLNLTCGFTKENILLRALNKNQYNGMRLLLEKGADPNRSDLFGCTILHEIFCYCDKQYREKYVKLALKHGANINAVNFSNQGPLHTAIEHNLWDYAKFLIDNGAKVDNLYKLMANRVTEESAIEFVIEHASQIDRNKQFSCNLILDYFIEEDFNLDELPELKKVLNKYGIDTSDRAIRRLQRFKDEQCQKMLKKSLKSTIDVNKTDRCGNTSLHLLLNKKNVEADFMLELTHKLIARGADLNLRNKFGYTPLNLAAKNLHLDIVSFILAKITDTDESLLWFDEKVYTSIVMRYSKYCDKLDELALATIFNYPVVVDRLIEMGYGINIVDKHESLLHFSVRLNRVKIVKLFLEAGFCTDWYNFHYFGEINLEIACLLFEFNNITNVREIIIQEFQRRDLQFIDKSTRATIYLFTYFFAIKLQTNRAEMSMLLDVFEQHKKLSDIFKSCIKKLQELKKIIFGNGMSIFGLLSKKLEAITAYLKDDDNFKACQDLLSKSMKVDNYDVYWFIVKVRLNLAMKKRKLLDLAKNNLNRAFEDTLSLVGYNSLPDNVVLKIFSYLNNRELKKIAMYRYK